jgi:hypothetical protein
MRRDDGTFDIGNEFGKDTQFTSDYQPESRGRKPSRFKQIISQLRTANEEPLTREDYNNIIAHLLSLTPEELKSIASDNKTPIAVIIIASSIAGDIDNKNLTNTEKLIDRIFGKDPIKQEISGLNIKFINYGNKDGDDIQ